MLKNKGNNRPGGIPGPNHVIVFIYDKYITHDNFSWRAGSEMFKCFESLH